MNRKIFITNGMARCGKDTFALFVSEIIPTWKCSSIDIIKNIAIQCGWKGGKTEKDRKFLSDLKMLTSEYSDLSFNYVVEKVSMFRSTDYFQVMLIDIREPEEIEKAKIVLGAKTILIKNDNIKQIDSNMADANVYNYEYDYVIENNGTLEEFKETVKQFVEENILNKKEND